MIITKIPEICFVSKCCGYTVHRVEFNEEKGMWFVCDKCGEYTIGMASYRHTLWKLINTRDNMDALMKVFDAMLQYWHNIPLSHRLLIKSYIIDKLKGEQDLYKMYKYLLKYCSDVGINFSMIIQAYHKIVHRCINMVLDDVKFDMMKEYKVRVMDDTDKQTVNMV